ncbi:Gfo/Idh/MocA family protein [Catenuloplanes japonicus]|uniref:Gfo/Idh/MocA family protein n=1 Tax=Catenuloplanes japonicus TaxID=33876 RepID=UPI000525054A|nr:Gfo/Idh/MocA family oxidoreductase [Catenuloplanes japonicus]
MPDRPIGVGIAGLSATGGWATAAHLPALAAVDGIELRALATGSPASARAASARYGVPGYTSVAHLAADENVDLVVVAVKVPAHRELLLPALYAGIPVLSEWPLAVDLAEAEELQRAAGGTRTFIGLQGRASPVFRWVRDLVGQGHVGEVLSATVVASSTEWGTPVSPRAVYTLDRALGATMLTIAFGSAIDLVSMVVGELRDVVATTATRRPRVPLTTTGQLVPMSAEDQIAISGTVAGGAILSAHHRGGAASGAGFSLVIDGTDGRLEITGAEFPHIGPVTVRGAGPALPDGYDRYPHLAGTHIHTLAHAYAAIRDDLVHGTTLAPGFAHAVRRHQLLDAITRSARTGQRVVVNPQEQL